MFIKILSHHLPSMRSVASAHKILAITLRFYMQNISGTNFIKINYTNYSPEPTGTET